MKKILFYIMLASLFLSLIMTLSQGHTIIFSFKNMLDLFSEMPRVNMSIIYNSLTGLDLSIWQNVPIFGTIIEISQSLLIGLIFICDCIVQVATFVIYLVPRLFTASN